MTRRCRRSSAVTAVLIAAWPLKRLQLLEDTAPALKENEEKLCLCNRRLSLSAMTLQKVCWHIMCLSTQHFCDGVLLKRVDIKGYTGPIIRDSFH